MTPGSTRPFERPAFGALVAFLLAPIVAQGMWRPWVHVLGQAGEPRAVTGAALAIAGSILLFQYLRADRSPFVAFALGAVVAGAAVAGLSLGTPGLLTLVGVAAAVAFGVPPLVRRLPPALDGLLWRHKRWAAAYVLLASVAVVSTARLSVFMADSAEVGLQALPGVAFIETHSCLTAYVHAAELGGRRVANLYDAQWWQGSQGFDPRAAGVENPYHPFVLDYFAYPPAFLLSMAPLTPLEGDFPAQRALWFGLNGLLLAAGLWIVARWIDGPNAHRVLLLAPLFFGSLPILATLQVGNFQVAVVVISVLAMIAFERERPALGGALLAFAILSKLSPGVLGIVLLVQRRWRSAAWTAAFGLFYLALSLLTVGPDPLVSFLADTLPRIRSGQAFAFLDDHPFSIVTNASPFGLPFKLQLIGLGLADPWALGRRIAQLYTVVPVALAIRAGLRRGDRLTEASKWMALLVLGALQSPFAPAYVVIGLLWALTLMAADVVRSRDGVALVALGLALTVMPPLPLIPLAIFSIVQMTLAIGVSLFLLIRRR